MVGFKTVTLYAIQNLEKKLPLLVLAENLQLFNRIDYWLKRARVNLEQSLNFDHVITDCGNAVEAMLQVLYSSARANEKKMTLNDLVELQRREIVELFGEDIYRDMAFIKEERNRVDHPNIQPPDYGTVLKVMTRADLFYKLFRTHFLSQ